MKPIIYYRKPTGIRAPWLVVSTACSLSTSPQTRASTFLAILTWHRGIGQRGMVLNLHIIAQVPGGPKLSEVYKRFKGHAATGEDHHKKVVAFVY